MIKYTVYKLDAMYSTGYREHTFSCVQCEKEMGEYVQTRIQEVCSRVHNDKEARLSHELGQLLLENVKDELADLNSLEYIKGEKELCKACKSCLLRYRSSPRYDLRRTLLRLIASRARAVPA